MIEQRPIYEIGYMGWNSCRIFPDRICWNTWVGELTSISVGDVESVTYRNGLPLVLRPCLEFVLKNGEKSKIPLFGFGAKFTGRHSKGAGAVNVINGILRER